MQTTSYLYRPTLKRAFETTRKFSHLWFFGLFAVLVSAGGEYEIIYRAFNNPDNSGVISTFLGGLQSGWQDGLKLAGADFWQNLARLIATDFSSVAAALFAFAFIVALTLFVIWLAVSAQIALIKGCSQANKNKSLPIAEGLDYASKNFWPVMGSVAILKLTLFILIGLLGYEIMLLIGTGVFGIILYIISFIIFVLAVLMISFILKYQVFYILLKRQKFAPAFRSAWKLFQDNWLISLEMALIMFVVYLVAAGLSAFIITLCAGVPIVIIPLYLGAMPGAFKVIFAALAVVLMVAGVFAVTAIMTTFQWAGWTALFERLAGDDENVSKLERWGEELKKLPETVFG